MRNGRIKSRAATAAFVYLSALTMAVASERVYWYLGGLSLESVLGIAVFYMVPTLAALWALGSGPSKRLHQVVLGGAIFAFAVEGILTTVVYEDGPLPIMAALFVGWHGLFSVVGFWYLTRRWLLERRRVLLTGAATLMGVYWGLWTMTFSLPGAFDDLEGINSVMAPGEFLVYALVVGAAFAIAHWLLGYVWPKQFQPGRRGGTAIVLLLGAYFAVAVLLVVPWAPLKLAALIGGTLWLLRRSREATADEPSIIESLQGRVALRDAALLMAMPVAASAVYAGIWSLGLQESAVNALNVTLVVVQVLSGFVAFGWAARRARRHDRELVGSPRGK